MARDFDDPFEEDRAFPRYSGVGRGFGPRGAPRVQVRLSAPAIARREAPPPLVDEGPALAPKSEKAAADEVLSFLEISLRREDGKPFAKEKFEVKLPDGSTRKGALGDDGRIRLDKIPKGVCEVSFPALEA